ncbi:ABC transporter substrate-binding protein [Thermoanaerobacterium sp. RBIITD]|uniref:ABC transporter substrate-binding protein n=1 Tax=Thermoanaerobacterium sp. RBIITD TaxID=1550240 RepID=UPI000BB684E2|nr:ABC transporter substrate-binding protein [Thermoanaerobacterium sp. RBIITD]SNX52715.1 hypothetical protein SAMN05660242_0137 [Thermoanaerobacterium sp. RBIITD]
MKQNKWMKDMTFKEKIDYIWDYYKIHMIVGTVVLILVISFINSAINSKDYVFDFSMLGTTINLDKQSSFEYIVTKELLGTNPGKKQALVEFYMLSKGNNGKLQLDPPSTQKLMVKIAAGEVSVMALDRDYFEIFAKQGVFTNLDNVKELNLNNLKTEKLGSTDKISAGTYGIDIGSSNKYLDAIGYDYKDKIIAIVSNTKNKDLAIKFMKWLLNIK